jgi:hypothetical protein
MVVLREGTYASHLPMTFFFLFIERVGVDVGNVFITRVV